MVEGQFRENSSRSLFFFFTSLVLIFKLFVFSTKRGGKEREGSVERLKQDSAVK